MITNFEDFGTGYDRGYKLGVEHGREEQTEVSSTYADWAVDFYAKDTGSCGAETVVETSPEYKQRALDALLEIAEDCGVKPSYRIKAATDLFFAAPK